MQLPEIDNNTSGLKFLDVDEELGVAVRLQRGQDLFNGGLDLGAQILEKLLTLLTTEFGYYNNNGHNRI